MNRAYGLMLRGIRAYLRVRRGVIRLLPEGIGTIASVFQHFNFLRLIPTFIAIALAPDHFFRRFDRVIKGKYPLFSSPAQSVVQMAAALVAVGLWGGLHLNEKGVVISLLILGITCPIWSYVLLLIVTFAFSKFNWSWVQAVFVDKANMFWLNSALAKMWSPRAIARLSWGRYLQATVLFSVYSIVALPLSLVPGIVLFLLAIFVNVYMPMGNDIGDQVNPLSKIIGAFGFLLAAYAVSWLILRPLAYLFVYSSKYPHEAAMRYETLNLQQQFNRLFFRANTVNIGCAADKDTDLLKQALTVLMARWGLTERALARKSPAHLHQLLEERKALAEDLLQYRVYLERGTDDLLIAKLDRIESGQMLVDPGAFEIRETEPFIPEDRSISLQTENPQTSN
jgi:hypothetical protein